MNNLMDEALVFIGSAVILVPIFHRLGFGSVIGYLIAGILVGPYGLGLIRDDGSVLKFAELGVVILLFIIGLEIQPQKLWGMRKGLLGLGATQLVISTFLFATIGFATGLDLISATILGFALSISSTAFALQVLMDKNQLHTVFGRGSFSILLMQDLIAIPVVAIIPFLTHSGETTHSLLMTAVFFPSFLIVAVLTNKMIVKPVFRMVATTRAREIFTAATLFIVLGVASVMVKFGLSAALGTFIAGMLLADSEYRHELEANLDPFKSAHGTFFIAIGMGACN